MLKYVDTLVTFSEVPDEVTLCINISNCPIRCPECHSKYLWEDVGTPLNKEELFKLIKQNEGISCVCFMGGDRAVNSINILAKAVKDNFDNLRVAWYSGQDHIDKELDTYYFDYIKIGSYKPEFGPINNPNTNQVLLARGNVLNKMDANSHTFYDITDKFWNK